MHAVSRLRRSLSCVPAAAAAPSAVTAAAVVNTAGWGDASLVGVAGMAAYSLNATGGEECVGQEAHGTLGQRRASIGRAAVQCP